MSSIASYQLDELSSVKLRELLGALGGSSALTTGDPSRMTSGHTVSRVRGDSIRSRIAAKLLELQDRYGDILTPKNSLVPGPAREEYEEWYLEQRRDDIGVKYDEKHYRRWAHVHLADTLKFRKETMQ